MSHEALNRLSLTIEILFVSCILNMVPTAVAPATESNAALKKPLGSDTSANDQKSRKNEHQEDVDAEGDDDAEDEVVAEGGGTGECIIWHPKIG